MSSATPLLLPASTGLTTADVVATAPKKAEPHDAIQIVRAWARAMADAKASVARRRTGRRIRKGAA